MVVGINSASVGYGKSSSGIASQDYMDSLIQKISVTDVFQQRAGVFSEAPSLTNSLFTGNTRTETLMSQMSNKVFTAPKVNVSALNVDANKSLSGASQVAGVTSASKGAIADTKAQFTQDYKQAQNEGLACLKQAAINCGHDPSSAADQMIPDSASTKAGAMAFMACEAASAGLGSLATATTKVVYVAMAAGDEKSKNMSPDEQRAVFEEMTRVAQSSNAPTDTRASGGASSPEVSIANLDAESMELLMLQTPEQQPEFMVLDNAENELKNVENDLGRMSGKFTGSTALDGIKDISACDAGHAQLCGDTIAGIGALPSFSNTTSANDMNFDSVQNIVQLAPKSDVPSYALENEMRPAS